MDFIKPTYIENWPVELKALSMHQEGLALTVDDAVALGKSQIELHEFWQGHLSLGDEDNRLVEIARELDGKVRRVMAQAKAPGVFVRLGSRSPKDSYWWWRDEHRDAGKDPATAPWPITSGQDAVKLLLETSERVNDDLLLAVANNYSPHIWVRAWEEMLPWQEFRCFIHEGRILGISQYDYMGRKVHPQLVRDRGLYVNAVMLFLNKRVIPSLHIPSAVVDLYVQVNHMPSGRGRKASARLLEINPYFSLTDPCLFTWEELDAKADADEPPTVKINEEDPR